ncbi:hypothetical protein WDU94_000233 [Cyamophila willieti]
MDLSKTNQAILETGSRTDILKNLEIVECVPTNLKKPNSKIKETAIIIGEPATKLVSNEQEREIEETELDEPMEIPCDVVIKEDLVEDPLRDPLELDDKRDNVERSEKGNNVRLSDTLERDTIKENTESPDNNVSASNELESIENTQNTADSKDVQNGKQKVRKIARKRRPRKKISKAKPQGQNIPPAISKYADLIANAKLETCNRYQCPECSSSFSTIYSLNAHLLRHQGKIYACEFCGKTFGAQATLHHHLQVHEGFKYTCDKCTAEFTLKHSWKRHMLIHAGNSIHVFFKNFICFNNIIFFKISIFLKNSIHVFFKNFICFNNIIFFKISIFLKNSIHVFFKSSMFLKNSIFFKNISDEAPYTVLYFVKYM